MLIRLFITSSVVVVVLFTYQQSAAAAPQSNGPIIANDATFNIAQPPENPKHPDHPDHPDVNVSSPAVPQSALSQRERLQNLGRRFADPSLQEEEEESAGRLQGFSLHHDDHDVDKPIASELQMAQPEFEDRPVLGQNAADPGGEQVNTLSGGSDGHSSWFLNTITALGVVLGIIFTLRWLINRMTGTVAAKAGGSVVEVLSRTSVAPRNHVLLLRVGQRILIVGDSSAGLRTLANIDDPQEVAQLLGSVSAGKMNSSSNDFNQVIDRLDTDYEREQWIDEGGDGREHVVDRARDSVSSLLSRMKSMASRHGGGVG